MAIQTVGTGALDTPEKIAAAQAQQIAEYQAAQAAKMAELEKQAAATRAAAELVQVVQVPKNSGVTFSSAPAVSNQPAPAPAISVNSFDDDGKGGKPAVSTITQTGVTVATGTAQNVTIAVEQKNEPTLVEAVIDWAASRISKHQPIYRKVMYEYPDYYFRFEYGSGRFIISAAEAGQLYLNAGGKDSTQWLSEGTTKLPNGAGHYRGIVRVKGIWYDANIFSINAIGQQEWDPNVNKFWDNAIDISRVNASHYNQSANADIAKDVNVTVSNPFITGSINTGGGSVPVETGGSVGSGVVSGGGGVAVDKDTGLVTGTGSTGAVNPVMTSGTQQQSGGFKDALPLIAAALGIYTALK